MDKTIANKHLISNYNDITKLYLEVITRITINDIELITIKERREDLILKPLLKSLKLMQNIPVEIDLSKHLLKQVIKNFNGDIVKQDLDALVAIVNIA